MASERPQFDFGSVVPLYEQAADYIQAQIESGALQPGDRFPDMRKLAEDWGIAYQTVRRAMRARPVQERALEIAEAVYGPDHLTVAIRLNNLALILRDLGMPAEARPLQERALAITEARRPPGGKTGQ